MRKKRCCWRKENALQNKKKSYGRENSIPVSITWYYHYTRAFGVFVCLVRAVRTTYSGKKGKKDKKKRVIHKTRNVTLMTTHK